MIINQLITGLRRIAATNLELPLIPLNNNKQPLGDGWQNRPFTVTKLIEAIEKGGVEVPIKGKSKKIQLQGFGLLTGRPITVNNEIYYLMAVDQDGPSVIEKINELSGGEDLPKTVAFTSGRPGRCQYLFLVPEAFKDAIRTKKIKAGTSEDDGKPELLELRWNNLQSVLPPSVHPLTGQYHWVEGCAIDEIEMAIAPDWILELMLCDERSSGSAIAQITDHETKLPLMSDATTIKNSSTPETEILPQHLEPIQGSSTDGLPRHPDQIKIPVPAPVPLIECCRKEVRDWVNTGIQEGSGRNDAAINVGFELIAVERHLQCIGQTYSDSARSLFSEFCQRCGMTAKEDEDRWKWCESKDPSPSCGEEGIAACIKGWYWREVVKPQQCNDGKQKHNGGMQKRNGGTQKGQKPPSASSAKNNPSNPQYEQFPEQLVMEHIDEILDQNLNDAYQDLELNKLAKLFNNFNASEIRTIANKRIKERELEDNLAERKQELERLETLTNYEYSPFRDLFYDSPETAQIFENLCQINRKIQPQYFLSILSCFSTLIGIKASVTVPVLGRFRGTLNTSMVGESGEGKSIVSGILLKPLYRLQKERRDKNRQQIQEYENLVEAWEKQHKDDRGPKPRKENHVTINDGFLVINEYSREGIVRNHADNPNGLLIHQEELVAIQRAQNMYRQGKGDDRQFLNNLYDNNAISRALKSERLEVEETAVAITGGYQPEVILGEMGDLSDPDGQWARFNFICGHEKQIFTDLNQGSVDVSGILYDLYQKALLATPVECHLEQEGINLLQEFINQMEKKRWTCLEEGWRAVLSKAAGEVCRIALNLHWQNCLLNNRAVDPVIPAIAIKTAIKIKRFFLSQIEMIRYWGHADPNREDSLAAIYQKILKIAKRVALESEVLTIRMVQATRSGFFKNLKADGILKIFKDLAAMGKAKLVKYKRGYALLIDSMLGDGEKSSIPPSPNPSNNTKELNSSPPVLLETVGEKSNTLQQIKASINQSFTSFVGFVGTVGSCIFPVSQVALSIPTIPTVSTIPLPLMDTGFQEQQVQKIEFQHPTKNKEVPELDIEVQHPTKNKEVSELDIEVQQLVNLMNQWEKGDLSFSSDDELLAWSSEQEHSLNEYLPEVEKVAPDFMSRYWVFLERQLDLLSSPPPPTLDSLKALLLACQTWVQLKSVKKQHSEPIKKAYDTLTPQEQLKIDGIEATAIPHDVYKYVGATIERNGQFLESGALVYLDPTSNKKSRRFVPVWLLHGLEQGWQLGLDVSRDCLQFVEKVVSEGLDAVEGHQGELLDGLS